ncbi:MAG: hypothetical protein ACREHD_22485 [Pirellulales bacterium]
MAARYLVRFSSGKTKQIVDFSDHGDSFTLTGISGGSAGYPKWMVESIEPLHSGAGTGAGKDARLEWLNLRYNTIVRSKAGIGWVEVENESGSLQRRYFEAERTDDYIELFSPLANKEIRYFAAWAECKIDGEWKRIASGHWQPPSGQGRPPAK